MQWENYKHFDSVYGFSQRCGFQLTDKQIVKVEESLPWGKFLNKLEVGCGKTVLSTVTSLMAGYDVTVVTVPPILIPPWVEWLSKVSERVVEYTGNPRERAKLRPAMREARWIVCSHAIYRDDYSHMLSAVAARKYEVIVDECFVGSTLVTTNLGPLAISEIVEMGKATHVLSFDFSTNALEWKKIVRRISRPRTKTLVKVTHDSGQFVCTDSHKIAVKTPSGSYRWVQAGKLDAGAVLCAVSPDIRRRPDSVQGVRSAVRHSKDKASKLLLPFVQNEGTAGKSRIGSPMAGVYAGHLGQLTLEGSITTRRCGAHEKQQSNERPNFKRKDGENAEKHRAQTYTAGGKRQGVYETAEAIAGLISRGRAGARNSYRRLEAGVRLYSKLLQGGLSLRKQKTSSGVGRNFASVVAAKAAGREKNSGVSSARVVSVEIYESTGSGNAGISGDKNQRVFDLEVEDNHNYFANGVLVSNCHFLKNPASVLFKRVKDMVAGDAGCQMLTGTPISKPLDGYTYIKIKSPNTYRSYTHFESVHVAERDFFKKPTKYANLDLLRTNLNFKAISATKEEMFGYNIKAQFPNAHYNLDPAHKALYEQLVNEQLLSFDDVTVIDATTVQKLMHALQQVIVNWDHFGNDPTLKSAAYAMLDQTIEETECATPGKSKLIVWTKYKRTSQRVWDYCNSLGIKTVAAFSGSNAQAAAKAFMEDDSCRILVAQPQSAGAGLNPQYVCWESLYLEIDTVPIYARQSLGRIDRKGQTRIPRQKIAVARGTVQERLLKNLLENDDLVQEIEPSKKSVRDMLLGRG